MNPPKVSIVTICLNSAQTLEKTIQSVLHQTYKNIEYIVVDGGSTDGTLELIKKYENSLSRWISEPDQGISAAYNKGIKMSSGEIIGLINSDDWYEPDAAETAVSIFLKNPGAGVVHGDLQYWFKDQKEMYLEPSKKIDHIQYEMVLNHSTCFVKKYCYEKHGTFDEKLKYAMDYELMLRFHKNSVQFAPANKLIAHMHLGGKSDRHWMEAYKEVLKSQIKLGDCAWVAVPLFLFKILRTYTRNVLKNIGLNSLVVWYRKLQSRKKYL